MAQITGYVKEIYKGTVKAGRSEGKPFWSITLDTDVKLSTFNAGFMDGVVEGKEYTFTYESDGKYANLTAPTVPCIRNDTETIAPDTTTAPQADEPVRKYKKLLEKEIEGASGVKMYPVPNKDEAIRKAVALKAAVEYVSSVLGGTGTVKDVLSYAAEFEEYLK